MSNDMEFNIGIVGPSRIGKTSLVTAILSDSQTLLAGTPIIFKAKDLKTNARINQHKNELQGSLRTGEFDSGAMGGTQEPFEFKLLLSHTGQNQSNDLTLRLLDFPGGWMEEIQLHIPKDIDIDIDRPKKECAKFIRESSVLLVVVDASLIMEASSPSEKGAINGILNVNQTRDIVESWARARAKKPALLLICPVKCESYFDDNGGSKNRADELRQAVVEDVYRDLLAIIKKEQCAEKTEILYVPVDTLGCVEFVSAKWEKNANADGGYTVDPHFKVRRNAKEALKGADDVLIAIAKLFLNMQTQFQEILAKKKEKEAATAYKKLDESYYERFVNWFGIETKAREEAKKLRSDGQQALNEAESTGQALAAIAKRPFGSRVRYIRKLQD